MSSIAAYVENLSDQALYNKLKSHGIPAGPVVASTRSLYRRKLIQKLENQETHSDENPEEDEPSFSQPDNSRWSNFTSSSSPRLSYEPEEVPSRLNLSYSSPIYRPHEEEGGAKSRFSYLDSQDSSRTSGSGSTLFSKDSTSYAFRKSLSGIRDENSFSRLRRTPTDTLSRPELSTHFRGSSYSEEYTARMARLNREQSKKGLRLMMCGALIAAAILVLYIVYSAWSENDPYHQIEEEAKKLIEEYNR